jgi:hypothetical protein
MVPKTNFAAVTARALSRLGLTGRANPTPPACMVVWQGDASHRHLWPALARSPFARSGARIPCGTGHLTLKTRPADNRNGLLAMPAFHRVHTSPPPPQVRLPTSRSVKERKERLGTLIAYYRSAVVVVARARVEPDSHRLCSGDIYRSNILTCQLAQIFENINTHHAGNCNVDNQKRR